MPDLFDMPANVRSIYPNRAQNVDGTPVIVYRDHRWMLPVAARAMELKLLEAPVTLVTFDRHRDSLVPEDNDGVLPALGKASPDLETLVNCVKYHLSPRDDDWIIAGMELGLIGDVVQFGSATGEQDCAETVTSYLDRAGKRHVIHHLGMPKKELSFKGVLVNDTPESMRTGVSDLLAWDARNCCLSGDANNIVLDIDLDYFTIPWERYTFPFPAEVYDGEFQTPCQSQYYEDYLPIDFVRELIEKAGVVTVATEPQFCDGAQKAESVLRHVNELFFRGRLLMDKIKVDYMPDYPSE